MRRNREDSYPAPFGRRPMRTGGVPQPGLGLGSKLTTNDALTYLRDVKNKFQDNKEIYDTFLEIMKEFKAQRINTEGVIEKVKQLFKGHRELILGFNTFLPKGYEITLPEEVDEPKQAVEFDQAINYVNKIKTRFASDERVYKAFLEILNMYRKGQKSISMVYEEVAMLFRHHRDLLEEFTYFLPDSTAPGQQPGKPRVMPKPGPQMRTVGTMRATAVESPALIHRKMHQRKSARRADELIRRQQGEEDEDRRPGKHSLTKELGFFDRVKQRMKSSSYFNEFLKCLHLFAQDIISKQELNCMVSDLLARYPDLSHGFNDFLFRIETQDYEIEKTLAQSSRVPKHELAKLKGERYLTKPVSEMDVSSWERSTTSYVKLPSNYPKLRCSGRGADVDGLLNDIWVSVTSGSEDYSFKHMRKNQYEEHLFRCEDDRFDLDMCIQCNASAMRAMGPLEADLAHVDPEDRQVYRIPENALSAIHLRAIQRIYGEHGQQIVALMKQNPAAAIPVIMARLKEKDVEWQRQKQAMARIWLKVYEANYHKSLDHRSFYFKQTDKKNLGAKAMMQEVKDIQERRRLEEPGLQSLSNPLKPALPAKPDMVFDYGDQAVHDDVFKVMKYSFEEVVQGEGLVKLLEFWTQFVEPFFGLPPRPLEQLKVEEEAPLDPMPAAEGGRRKEPRFAGLRDAAARDSEPASGGADGEAADADTGHEDGSRPDADARPSRTPEMEVEETEQEDVMLTDAGDSDDGEDPDLPASRMVGLEQLDEASGEREFINCKPLAPSEAVRQAHGGSASPSLPASRVIYGNDAFYVFFRLHHYLYDRLRRARKCSVEKVGQGNAAFPTTRADADLDSGPLPPMEPAAQELHQQFMSMLLDLLEGSLEAGQYEDNVRALLGTNSYVLFTLDKLVFKLVKQLQHMHQDEITMKLAELHRYEASRSLPLLDAVYAANVRVLIAGDENTFRIEFRDNRSLTVQLLDQDRSEVMPGVLDPGFQQYLRQFTDTPLPSPLPRVQAASFLREVKPTAAFLRRSLPSCALGLDADTAAQAELRKFLLTNGLECKLSCSTSKVSYVLDTEDILVKYMWARLRHRDTALWEKIWRDKPEAFRAKMHEALRYLQSPHPGAADQKRMELLSNIVGAD